MGLVKFIFMFFDVCILYVVEKVLVMMKWIMLEGKEVEYLGRILSLCFCYLMRYSILMIMFYSVCFILYGINFKGVVMF